MAKEKREEKRVAESVASPSAPAPGYETFDPEEAQRYTRAGGHLVAVTARYPSKEPGVPSFRPGKRHRFLESKEQLETLVTSQEDA